MSDIYDGVIWYPAMDYVPDCYCEHMRRSIEIEDESIFWKISEIFWKIDLHKWSDYR